MKCCPYCFNDDAISYYVEGLSNGTRGTCDFCGASNAFLYEITPYCELANTFERLFTVIAPSESVAPDRMISGCGPLPEVFASTWKIFNFNSSLVLRFLCEMFGSEEWFKRLQDTEVVISPGKGERPLDEYSIFGSTDWSNFSSQIKHKSRFFTKLAHVDVFEDLLGAARSTWKKSHPLFRARIWTKKKDPVEEDFHEPPESKASDGRMRSAGIPCIYTADTPETAAAEVRAGMHDIVAIATILPLHDFEYADLSVLDDISPLANVDCSRLVANRKHLRSIVTELTRPVRTSDSTLDYVPFQYLSELIQQFGNEAIGYPSVMHREGKNIACFAHFNGMFELHSIKKYRVDELAYGLYEF